MREVFPATEQKDESRIRVFYTLRPQDRGKSVIWTTAGKVDVSSCMGRILPSDAGKRLYFIVGGTSNDVQVENDAQYAARVKREETRS